MFKGAGKLDFCDEIPFKFPDELSASGRSLLSCVVQALLTRVAGLPSFFRTRARAY